MINIERQLEGRLDHFGPPFTTHDNPGKEQKKSKKSSENTTQIIGIFGLMASDDDMNIGDLCIGIRYELIKLDLEAVDRALVIEETGVGNGAHLQHSLLSSLFPNPRAHEI